MATERFRQNKKIGINILMPSGEALKSAQEIAKAANISDALVFTQANTNEPVIVRVRNGIPQFVGTIADLIKVNPQESF